MTTMKSTIETLHGPDRWKALLYVLLSAAVVLLSAGVMEASIRSAFGAEAFVALDRVGRAAGALYTWDAAARRAALEGNGRTVEVVVGLDAWRAGDDVLPLEGGAARIGPDGTVEVPAADADEIGRYLRGEIEAPAAPPPAPEEAPAPRPRPARPAGPAPFVRTIVIDAGHGGHDAGAISRHRQSSQRIREKDVVLAIARRLRDDLAARYPTIRIVMTRDEDVFIPLEGRVRIAREADADLFVSIHANSVRGQRGATATGTEVYFFSNPTDADAAAVAELEGVFDIENSGIDPVVWDLMLAGNVIESNALARDVDARLARAIGIPRRGVKSARFYVLHYGVVSNIPSILIETGFVSNPHEAERLARPDVQTAAADSIADAIEAFMNGLEERYPGGRGWRRE